MRKYLVMGLVALVVGSVASYWFFSKGPSTGDLNWVSSRNVVRNTPVERDDGVAEQSDVIEPLVVDAGVPRSAPSANSRRAEAPMARAELTAGMRQPPRPDARLRMPYADEKKLFFMPFDPIAWILESPLPNFFSEVEAPDVTEESEPMPMPMPMPIELPKMNPHHHDMHCPAGSFPYRTR